jgi:two-component system response regulator
MPGTKTDTQFTVRSKRPIRPAPSLDGPILVVDDSLDDAHLAERSIHQLNPKFAVIILGSGKELVEYLQGKRQMESSAAAEPARPRVILLDLKMPEMDGLEVLEWCRSQAEAISSIPVVVTTNFSDLPFMKRAYALGARSYLIKPVDHNALRSVFSSLSISA